MNKDIVKDAIKMANGVEPCWFVASQMIHDLTKCVKELQKANNELRKKHSKGEINEAYAKTIEATKDEISGYKVKINKLEQKLTSQANKITKLEAVVGAAKFLIDVKEHKDLRGKDEWYQAAQPAAWRQVKEALSELRGE